MLTCIEHEQALKEDSVQLSRQWLIARELEEQTMEAYRSQGDKDVSLRNVGPEALRLIQKYGIIPYTQEKTSLTSSSVAEKKLTLLAEQQNLTAEQVRRQARQILPQFATSTEEHGFAFYFLSCRYRPEQFAESIMYDQQWQWYASNDEYPWHKPFTLPEEDNRREYQYTNLPMEELYAKVIASLKQGHAVYWEYGKGRHSDHAMAIVGLRGDKLLCRNSYGKNWGRKGFTLLSKEYFVQHTCNVGIINRH